MIVHGGESQYAKSRSSNVDCALPHWLADLPSPAGKAWSVPNLSRSYSRLRNLAGLPRDLVLYLARHECGTKICREKGIEYARRLLGHSNISTTQRYMHLDDRELAEAQDLV
jgi:site-specific recombinase XerD